MYTLHFSKGNFEAQGRRDLNYMQSSNADTKRKKIFQYYIFITLVEPHHCLAECSFLTIIIIQTIETIIQHNRVLGLNEEVNAFIRNVFRDSLVVLVVTTV